ATKGIGRASAIMLCKAGAEVVAVSRNSESLNQLCNELNAGGGKSQFLSVDLSNTQEIKEKISSLLKNQKIDILVNNAGGPPGGKLLDANFEQFDEAFAPHLKAIHQLVQLIVPSMIENKFGRIINIISTSVKAPIVGLGVSNTVR